MDEHDIKGAQALVSRLCQHGIQWYRSNRAVAWNNTFNAIGGIASIYQGVESVEGVFLKNNNGGTDISGEINGPYILLAPPSKHSKSMVCLLGLYWNLTTDISHLSLYLNIFGQSNVAGVPVWHRGYRLELPHESGVHNYTHVQPCKASGWAKKTRVSFTDDSVSESYPAFPIPARSLTALCATLAVALHGSLMLATVVTWLKGHRMQKDIARLLNCSR